MKPRWPQGYLEEVLAGDDESQLGTEVFCLSLAPSHPLDQLRDVISHCLQEARRQTLSTAGMVELSREGGK